MRLELMDGSQVEVKEMADDGSKTRPTSAYLIQSSSAWLRHAHFDTGERTLARRGGTPATPIQQRKKLWNDPTRSSCLRRSRRRNGTARARKFNLIGNPTTSSLVISARWTTRRIRPFGKRKPRYNAGWIQIASKGQRSDRAQVCLGVP